MIILLLSALQLDKPFTINSCRVNQCEDDVAYAANAFSSRVTIARLCSA